MVGRPVDGARRIRRVRPTLIGVALLLTVVSQLVTAPSAAAHDLVIGQSEIVQDGARIDYELAVDYRELAKRVVGLDQPSTAIAADQTSRSTLRAAQDAVASYVAAQVLVTLDGTACAGALRELDIVRHRGVLFAVLGLSYACPSSDEGRVQVFYTVFFDDRSASEQTAHANLVDYRLAGQQGTFVFEPSTSTLVVGEPRQSSADPVGLGVAGGSGLLGLGVIFMRRRRSRRAPAHPGSAVKVTAEGDPERLTDKLDQRSANLTVGHR